MLDNDFIEKLIESNKPAQVYLVNGVKLNGKITEQDSDSFLMTCREKDENKTQLVFKRAVSTIQ